MRFLSAILFTLMATATAHAAQVGQFFSTTGDTVSIRIQRNGDYHAYIETTNKQATCTFQAVMTEVEEGDLRYTESNCALRILQADELILGVSVNGCARFCTPGANLRITRARKDASN